MKYDLPNAFENLGDAPPARRSAASMPLFRWCEACPHPEACSQFKMCRAPRHVTPLPALEMRPAPAAAPAKKAKRAKARKAPTAKRKARR